MRVLRGFFIVLGALFITALGIDAADSLRGSRATLLGQLVGSDSSVCPQGMKEVPGGLSFMCVDIFEASPGDACPREKIGSIFDTKTNIESVDCRPQSDSESVPWAFVSRDQAQALCLRAGKRLPSNKEWQLVALGSVESHCNLSSRAVAETGGHTECVSGVGAYDMIGNVWEWTSDEVIRGRYDGRMLPEAGFVQSADSSGIAIKTSEVASGQYGEDYFWNAETEAAGVMRGGFYGSDTDGGVYAAHTDIEPAYQGAAIGFRCVK